MTEADKTHEAALIQQAVAEAMIEMEAMKADNYVRECSGLAYSYDEDAFFTLADELKTTIKNIRN